MRSRLLSVLVLSSLAEFGVSANAAAASLSLEVELPNIEVAEYHRPYVAVWIEREDSSVAANLAVWYQQDRAATRQAAARGQAGEKASGTRAVADAKDSGSKWLPDLRQWWRRSGRQQTLPIDGVSGATRAAGRHQLSFSDADAALRALPEGQYRLVVEAVREVGGRELLRLPLRWPPTTAQLSKAQGERELGAVSLSVAP